MARARTRRERGIDYWPGFVDALSTLILGIIFMLTVFVVVQYYLSQEVAGKDTALQRLNAQIAQLTELKDKVSEIYVDYKGSVFNQALINTLELEGMIEIAEAVCLSAAARKESRGSHYHNDHPERDDNNFLKHSMVYLRDGKAVLEYSGVTLGQFPVKERVY